MAQILLIGGHGKVALLTTPLLVKAGHTVDAVIRNTDQAEEVAAAGASPIIADIETLDVVAFEELVAGHDVVVWAAGAGGGDPKRTYAVDRDAAIRSMQACERVGVSRYVMVSYFGARPDHGVPEGDSFYAYAEAKAAADTWLRDSTLDWVILAPSRLTLDEPSGRIAVGSAASGSTPVSRANVAEAIAVVVDHPEISRVTVQFTDGDQPVRQALLGAE